VALEKQLGKMHNQKQQVDARPSRYNRCDMWSSRIITDYYIGLLTQFYIYVYIYSVTASSFRIFTSSHSFTRETW